MLRITLNQRKGKRRRGPTRSISCLLGFHPCTVHTDSVWSDTSCRGLLLGVNFPPPHNLSFPLTFSLVMKRSGALVSDRKQRCVRTTSVGRKKNSRGVPHSEKDEHRLSVHGDRNMYSSQFIVVDL